MNSKINYKNAGVDVDKADQLVEWLQSTSSHETNHWKDSVVGGIGGFASLFRLPQIAGIKRPLLVSSTDGVGTKVQLAAQYRRMEGIGQDLVAMCVNDVLCCGATPLFFLDYYAVGKLDEELAKGFLTSVRKACALAGLALVGGETAEMPGTYKEGDFDCAGFVVGVVDEDQIWGARKVKAGDKLLAIESSGFHSNGYSLIRKVFTDDRDKWIDQLLKPTHIYTNLVKAWQKQNLDIHALAHITGGGFENLPRVLAHNTAAKLDLWQWPEIFKVAQERSNLSDSEMLKTLNCGVGLVAVVAESEMAAAQSAAQQCGFKSWHIGSVIHHEGPPQVVNLE